MFSLSSRFTALVQVCRPPWQTNKTSSKTFVPNNSHKISSNLVQLKSLHKFPKALQSCSGQTKWPWMLQLFVQRWLSQSLIQHLTFFFHQVFEGLPFHIIWDVADKNTVSFVNISIGFVAPASTSFLGPLFPAWIGLVLGFPIQFSVRSVNTECNSE